MLMYDTREYELVKTTLGLYALKSKIEYLLEIRAQEDIIIDRVKKGDIVGVFTKESAFGTKGQLNFERSLIKPNVVVGITSGSIENSILDSDSRNTVMMFEDEYSKSKFVLKNSSLFTITKENLPETILKYNGEIYIEDSILNSNLQLQSSIENGVIVNISKTSFPARGVMFNSDSGCYYSVIEISDCRFNNERGGILEFYSKKDDSRIFLNKANISYHPRRTTKIESNYINIKKSNIFLDSSIKISNFLIEKHDNDVFENYALNNIEVDKIISVRENTTSYPTITIRNINAKRSSISIKDISNSLQIENIKLGDENIEMRIFQTDQACKDNIVFRDIKLEGHLRFGQISTYDGSLTNINIYSNLKSDEGNVIIENKNQGFLGNIDLKINNSQDNEDISVHLQDIDTGSKLSNETSSKSLVFNTSGKHYLLNSVDISDVKSAVEFKNGGCVKRSKIIADENNQTTIDNVNILDESIIKNSTIVNAGKVVKALIDNSEIYNTKLIKESNLKNCRLENVNNISNLNLNDEDVAFNQLSDISSYVPSEIDGKIEISHKTSSITPRTYSPEDLDF